MSLKMLVETEENKHNTQNYTPKSFYNFNFPSSDEKFVEENSIDRSYIDIYGFFLCIYCFFF